EPEEHAPPLMLPGLLEAIRTLSYRISAIGLEPRLTNFHTAIETYESPFLAQNLETLRLLAHIAQRQGHRQGQSQHHGVAPDAGYDADAASIPDEDG
ncbi:MAG: hypothetical protein J0626_01420, partial [Rhodospirillaceae bacterium]|nr:hypothetical protein [Rhodospirillaceae bacterium]